MTFITPFESNPQATATYPEIIDYYSRLAKAYPALLQMREQGNTDSGFPLHTLILSTDGAFSPEAARRQGKCILLINNGIHPGEPEGIDATMMLVRDYLQKTELQQYLANLVIVIIPVYNIDGCLNRNSTTRTNQNGPESYGFRGNARNLDLNRDFIKCDTRNARSFNQIFCHWQPDIFIDNHTSNGADYQYTMTLIPTQHNKLEGALGKYLQDRLLPRLFSDMKARNWEMTPYVNSEGDPAKGIEGFLETPRYSTGYAALHHTIGFMPETHMLKPFPDRVHSTYALMDCMIRFIHEDHASLMEARRKAFVEAQARPSADLQWVLDEQQVEKLLFKGFEAKYKPSEVSGLPRLWYDRSAPYEKEVPFMNTFKAAASVTKPLAYIIPQAYGEVIERLQWNGVALSRLDEDRTVEVEMYYLRDFKTPANAYEGHFPHSGVKLETKVMQWTFHRGDYIVYTNQPEVRYLMETLEPQGTDSFFAWNFFDGVLGQKEYFSDYVFEDLAAAFLKEHPEVKAELEAAKKADPALAKSASDQLDFVYRRTPHYEITHRLYPIGRLMKKW